MFEDNPENDYLDIKHNGSVDYGKILYVIKENSNREGFCATPGKMHPIKKRIVRIILKSFIVCRSVHQN